MASADDAKKKRLQQCFSHANSQAAQGNFDYATEMFTQCVVGAPDNVPYLQGILANLKKKYDNNKKGSKLGFVKTAGARGLVKRAVGKKDWQAVIKNGVEVLKLNPWDASMLTAMADACRNLEFDEPELVYLRMALEGNPADPDVNRICAQALTERREFDQAIACWNRVQKARPDDREPANAIADLIVEKTIEKTARQATSEEAPATDTGSQVTAQSRPAPAETLTPGQVLIKQIKRNPNDVSKYLELAKLLQESNRLEKAIDVLQKAHKVSGGDPEVADRWNDTHVQLLRQKVVLKEREVGDNPTEEEKQELQRLRQEFNAKDVEVRKGRCKRYPNNLNYRYDLAVRYQVAGMYNEAIVEFQKARNDPKRAGLCMLALGQCFQKIKQYRLAMSRYEEAVREIPDGDSDHKKQALYLTAKLAFEMKVYDAAENYATMLGAIDFSYKDVPALLDKISRKREDGDEPE
jgi:tetratricopeptide (TPR) repeat protein